MPLLISYFSLLLPTTMFFAILESTNIAEKRSVGRGLYKSKNPYITVIYLSVYL